MRKLLTFPWVATVHNSPLADRMELATPKIVSEYRASGRTGCVRFGCEVKMDFKSKLAIQAPIEKLISHPTIGKVPAAPMVIAESPEAPPSDTRINPTVSAGEIQWHKDFSAARIAAGKSGKPVLLFQMMGRLDQRFC